MSVTIQDQLLLQRLNSHPILRARVESLLSVVENSEGDVQKADAAERRVIDELRHMGNEAITAWAERGIAKSKDVAQSNPELRPAGKKNSIGIRRLEQ